MTAGSRRRMRFLLLILTLFFAVPEAWSQSSSGNTPESEYKKLIKVDEEVQPLGANPFGESISLYDGSLSFEQTDISLPGAGPLLQISRSLKVTGENDYPLNTEGAFADWELDIPRIETIAPNQANMSGWLVQAGSSARCT
jgi:hypothetical protein